MLNCFNDKIARWTSFEGFIWMDSNPMVEMKWKNYSEIEFCDSDNTVQSMQQIFVWSKQEFYRLTYTNEYNFPRIHPHSILCIYFSNFLMRDIYFQMLKVVSVKNTALTLIKVMEIKAFEKNFQELYWFDYVFVPFSMPHEIQVR